MCPILCSSGATSVFEGEIPEQVVNHESYIFNYRGEDMSQEGSYIVEVEYLWREVH